MVNRKQKRFQKGYLYEEDSNQMKERTNTILELAEMRQNLWRCYRDRRESSLPKTKPVKPTEKGFQPAGRSKEEGKHMSITNYFEERRKEKKGKAKILERKWELLRTSLAFIYRR